MSTFSQWWTSLDKNPAPRQFTWVCGPERILVEDIVQRIRRTLNPDPWDLVTLRVGEVSENDIWAELLAVPTGVTPRLVIVRNAEKLEHTHRIQPLVKSGKKNPQRYIIWVSNDDALPREEGKVLPYLAFGTRGHAIECKPFTAATAKHAVSWVQAKVPMPTGVAGHLLNRSDGNMRMVRDMCFKLSMYQGNITLSVVNALLSQHPRLSFESAVIARDKKTALSALQFVSPDDYSRVIGSLDSTLDLVGMVHDMLVAYHTPAEIARAAGNRGFLVPDLIPVAKHYNRSRRDAIRSALAQADAVLRRGERVGVMEGLVALW